MKTQAWLKDAIISVIGSALIWLGSQMRDDFKTLVISVNNLSADVRVLAAEVTSERDSVRDHETRLREIEKHSK